MKNFLIKLLVFILVVGIVDYSFGVAFDYLRANAKDGDDKRIYDICKNNQYGIVILGSSRAHHHYVPDILTDTIGLSCYNAGFDGNGVILSYGILKLILEKYKPNLIIYDVEPAFDIEYYEQDNNCTRYLKMLKSFYLNDDVKEIFMTISKEDYFKNFSGIARHNSNIILETFSYFRKETEHNDCGFHALNGVMNNNAKMQETEIPMMDSMKINYFRKLLSDAKNSKVPMVVVYSPKYEYTNVATLDTIRKICKENETLYWDYSNNKKYIDTRLFKEPMHMNITGARLFTQEIASKLKEEVIVQY